MSDNVDTPSVDLLVKELCGVVKWDTLGVHLGLTVIEIEEIEQDYHETARRRMAMLNKWIKKETNPSWLKIISALERMSETTLANHLREKYTRSKQLQPSTTSVISSILGSIMTIPSLMASDTGGEQASEPMTIMKMDRKELVVRKLEEVEEKYLELIVATESALESVDPPQAKLRRFSTFYTKVRVTTVVELFDILEHHCFLDYTLLEKIISFFLKKRAPFVVSDLCTYIQDLESFKSSTTVRQFMESIEKAQKPLTTTHGGVKTCTVVLHLVGGWLDKTMTDLDRLLKELFQDKRAVLSHIQIVRGSVIVTYCAPQWEAESLISLAKKIFPILPKIGICGLLVADTVVLDVQSDRSIPFEFSLVSSITDDDTNLLSFLLDINTTPNVNFGGIPLLSWAISFRKINAVDLLLQANANPNFHFGTPVSAPLFMAILRNNLYVVDHLLKANADPNLRLKDGVTPLFYASELGYTDIAHLLIKVNANPNLHTDDGGAAIHIASQKGHSDVVKALLDANADPNCQTNKGETPLMLACTSGRTVVVSMLVNAKVDPNLQRYDKTTALHLASHLGYSDIVNILLDGNANPNHLSEKLVSPLMLACFNRKPETVRLLLKHGADPNLQHSAGAVTALMCACQSGCLESAELLLMSGADPSMVGPEGLTALDVAACEGHEDIVHLIQTVKLGGQSSTTSPVLTATEIATNVDNEAMSVLNKAMKNMLIVKSEPLISAQQEEARIQHSASTPMIQRSKPSRMTQHSLASTQYSDSTPLIQDSAPSPTIQRSSAYHTKQFASTSTQDTESTPMIQELASSPLIQRPSAYTKHSASTQDSPMIKHSASTPMIQRSASTPMIQHSASTPMIQRSASTPMIQRSASTPMIQRSASTPMIQRSASTPMIQRSASTPMIQRSASTTMIQRSASTPMIQRSASTPMIQRSASTPHSASRLVSFLAQSIATDKITSSHDVQ